MYENKLAKLVLNYSLKITKGDIVLIKGELSTEKLAKEFVKEIIKLGANPVLRLHLPEAKEYLVKYGNDEQLKFLPEFELLQTKTITAYIYIDSSLNSKALSNANPEKLATIQKAQFPLREIMNKREAEGKFRWCLCPYPTHAMAQEAGMSIDEYTEFLYNACKVTSANPVTEWKKVEAMQEKIRRRLTGGKLLHIVGKDTDLKLSVDGRKWVNCCGHRNMPDGEVFTSPVETSANGKILFDIPTTYNGNEVVNVRLEFKDGKVTNAKADKGEKFLIKMLDMDNGSRGVGEIAFGLNDNIKTPSKNILFDEKIGRSMHLAVGSSYEEAGGKNQSSLHWDLIKDMRKGSEVYLDGKLIYKNGTFVK